MELTIYIDGSPTDWLAKDVNEQAHTIALICSPNSGKLAELIDAYGKKQKNGIAQWKKLARGGKQRRKIAFDAFLSIVSNANAWFNIVVYREDELRKSIDYLCKQFGELGIGFAKVNDELYRHQFVDFDGHHVIEDKIIKILPLLFLAWVLRTMMSFYYHAINADYPDAEVSITICLNFLSGDSNTRKVGESLLEQLLHYDGKVVKYLYSSDASPELTLADNIAGFFAECLTDLSWKDKLANHPDRSFFCWKEFQLVNGELLGFDIPLH